ncbi:Exocyst subunit Exo70 family protein [Heracleum sosnowskyi]|uniref:Exocyst subunit Exo70 family protein n=1 Tax=Heracleum sosnowskyi TaxID=360622 RepID=A0AAD8JIV1_9APIA|nr:Exocyst subunit Exo70 family protein [Heracleum sosnowskyi]
MPRKGMGSLLFSSKKSASSLLESPSRPSFSDTVLQRTLEIAEPIIKKWDADTSDFASVTSLFYENRKEAIEFIKWVNNVQKSMHKYVSEHSSYSDNKLVRGQKLMEIAMKRLEKEFYQILSTNRAHLDPESFSSRSSLTSRASTLSSISDYEDDDELRRVGEAVEQVEDVSMNAVTDLKLIADCMISSGYGKECISIYRPLRKSIIDEAIYKLGVDKTISNQIPKMEWNVLEIRINNWLNAMKVVMETLFKGERNLCDQVFASSEAIREACFSDISKEGALLLFGFPELVAKNRKKSPAKIFRSLDMYTAIATHWKGIESIFTADSSSAVKSQALISLAKLGESVRTELTEFESSIQKDKSKALTAGIHNLTVDVMIYLSALADYSNVLKDILDYTIPHKASETTSYFNISTFNDTPAPAISRRFMWIIHVLLCKIGAKAKHFKDASLCNIFLANNLQNVVVKVLTSNLKYIVGDEWIVNHEAKVEEFAKNYERSGWEHVIQYLSTNSTATMTSPEDVKELFRKFSTLFDQAYRKQSTFVVADNILREEIQRSIAGKIGAVYRELYNTHRVTIETEKSSGNSHVVKHTPDDVDSLLSDLFYGSGEFLNLPSGSNSRRPRLWLN